jgi:CheY-like chemotaxis protein
MKPLPANVLIIEDDPADQAMLLSQLEKIDLQAPIQVVSDGAEALTYLSDPQYEAENLSVVFLSLELPTSTSLQLLEAIRSEERHRHLRIILMTSCDVPLEIDRCRALGFSSLLFKPITFPTFAGAVVDAYCKDGNISKTAPPLPKDVGEWIHPYHRLRGATILSTPGSGRRLTPDGGP